MNNEQDLQHFIADNPWLLNQNYERVIELVKNGIEYQVGGQNRVDLILRDKISGAPVVVEFKFTPFYRENIGQILEYKARVAMSFTKENSALFDIFKEYILVPKLALVVEQCDVYARVACNMAGVDVYEYQSVAKIFNDPEKLVTIKHFTEALKNDRLPFSENRPAEIEQKVYVPIKRILEELNWSNAWQEPRGSNAYFFPRYADFLMNRQLFSGNEISMGLYEDISPSLDVIIAYYSVQRDLLERFEQTYNKTYDSSLKLEWLADVKEGFLNKAFSRNVFFDDLEAQFKEELKRYLDTLKSIRENT